MERIFDLRVRILLVIVWDGVCLLSVSSWSIWDSISSICCVLFFYFTIQFNKNALHLHFVCRPKYNSVYIWLIIEFKEETMFIIINIVDSTLIREKGGVESPDSRWACCPLSYSVGDRGVV